MPKVPTVQEALALLAAVEAQAEDRPDIERPNYRGQIPPVVLLAVIRDLRQRVAALEARMP